jgi:hypothetical protein
LTPLIFRLLSFEPWLSLGLSGGNMTTDSQEKGEVRISVARRLHRFLKRHFSRLHGLSGGSVLMLWLSGGFILAVAGHGLVRVAGLVLLASFVACYIFLAYFYQDDAT